MVIQADGGLWALGNNTDGQLRDGTTICQNNFIRILDDVVFVSVGSFHTMAIRADGSLWAWGGNWNGQLGDGTTIDRNAPVKIMDDVIAVSAGSSHTMAITSDRVLWGWGHNGSGRLGYEGTAHELNPAHPKPIRIMEDVVTVSAGFNHTMAIKTDGSLWAWGFNNSGQLGNGTTTREFTPTSPIRIMEDVVAVSAGDGYTMAITVDGVLWGWGHNSGSDRLGLGNEGLRGLQTSPIKIMEDVAAVSAWDRHTIAVRTDGSLWTWGNNWYGQIGDGTYFRWDEETNAGKDDARSVPTKIMDNIMLPN